MKNYFGISEQSCPCCGRNVTPETYLKMMNKLRSSAGVPVFVNSWNRCERHNIEAKGVKDSSHMKGIATDIRLNPKKGVPMTSQELHKIVTSAHKAGFRRIVIYKTFVHVDHDISKAMNLIKVVYEA